MEIKLTIQEARLLKVCPACYHTLYNNENNSELVFWSDRDKDCITHYQCPYCDFIIIREFYSIQKK